MDAAPLLAVNNLSIRFEAANRAPVQAVKQVSFSARRGVVTALCGPSGSGKTTIGHCLMGLLPHTARLSGEARLQGLNLCGLDERRWRAVRGRQVAGVFQEPHASLNPVRNVGKQIGFLCRRHDCPDTAADLLEWVGLESALLRSFPHELSGGQAQRVLIAMALACQPGLLVADEPTASLDPVSGVAIATLLRRLTIERAMGLLLISHDRRLVEAFSDDQVWLESGRNAGAPPSHKTAPRNGSAPPRADRTTLLSVRGLCLDYGSPHGPRSVLDGASLELQGGEILALAGASGSGKSSLARVLVGLVRPSEGEVRLGDELLDWRRPKPGWRAAIQLLFQDPYTALNPKRRIRGALVEALERVGRPATDAAACLASIGLPPEMLDHFPHELSGGQRQRVALARALAVRPRLLILDEAFSALDIPVRIELTELVLKLRAELGLSCLWITHDLARIGGVADRVAVLHEGRIVECDECEQVLRRPRHPQTRRLLEALQA